MAGLFILVINTTAATTAAEYLNGVELDARLVHRDSVLGPLKSDQRYLHWQPPRAVTTIAFLFFILPSFSSETTLFLRGGGKRPIPRTQNREFRLRSAVDHTRSNLAAF